APEHVDVGDRRPADDRAPSPARLPQHGEDQSPAQREDAGDDRELDRVPEALQDLVEVVGVEHHPEVEVLADYLVQRRPSLPSIWPLTLIGWAREGKRGGPRARPPRRAVVC